MFDLMAFVSLFKGALGAAKNWTEENIAIIDTNEADQEPAAPVFQKRPSPLEISQGGVCLPLPGLEQVSVCTRASVYSFTGFRLCPRTPAQREQHR
jgi:hypothetical protein